MNVGKYLSGEDMHVGTARIETVKKHTEPPEALRLAEAHEFLANQAKQDEEKTIIVRLLNDSAAELRRLHKANAALLEALKDLDEAYCRAGSPLTKEERQEDRMRLIKARAAIAMAIGESA